MSDYKTTKYRGITKFYFNKIIDEIILIGNLNKIGDFKILDYGCGEKILSSKVKNVLNYDINPDYNEMTDIHKANFNVVVMNHVLMYMSIQDIEKVFKDLLKKKNLKFIFGLGTNNIIFQKIVKIIYKKNAYEDTKSTYVDKKNVIKKFFKIIKKKNIYFATELLLAEPL